MSLKSAKVSSAVLPRELVGVGRGQQMQDVNIETWLDELFTQQASL